MRLPNLRLLTLHITSLDPNRTLTFELGGFTHLDVSKTGASCSPGFEADSSSDDEEEDMGDKPENNGLLKLLDYPSTKLPATGLNKLFLGGLAALQSCAAAGSKPSKLHGFGVLVQLVRAGMRLIASCAADVRAGVLEEVSATQVCRVGKALEGDGQGWIQRRRMSEGIPKRNSTDHVDSDASFWSPNCPKPVPLFHQNGCRGVLRH